MSSVSLSVSVPGKSAETEAPVAPYLEQPLRRLQALVTSDREAQIRHGQELHQYITDELQYSPHVDEICERIGLMATLWFTQPGSTHQLSAGFIVMHCVSRANLPLLRKTKYKIITEFFNSTKTYLASPKLDITLINPGSRIMGHVVSLNDENSNYTVAGLVRDAREQLLRGTADQKKTICKCAILRELAMSTPTVFQQHAPVAVKDILEVCRTCTNARCGEALGEALYAALCVVSQREQRKEAKESIFNDCYKTAADCLRAANEAAETKAENKLDETMLGGLIILNELLRCADSRFEEQRQDVEDQQEPASNTVSSASSEWSSRYGMRLLANVLRHSRGSSGSSNRSSRTFTKSQMTTLSGKEGAQSQQPILALFAPLKRVVHESHTCKRTINDNIAELLELIFGQPRNREQEHRNNCCVELARAPHTQLLLLEIIPRMASLAASHIEPATLERCVYFIERHMQKTSKERDYRAVAFTSLGLLTFAVVSEESGTDSKREEQEAQRSQHEENVHNTKLKSTLLKRLHGGTYVTIRSMLVSPEHTPRRTSSAAIETRVLTCLSLLARSLRQDVRAFMKELLPTLLRGGLTEVVTRTLFDIHESISSLSALIKDGLLDQLWVKVMNRPRPPKYLPPPQEEYTSDYLPPPREDEQTLLALYILASFEFPIDSTETFLRHLSSVFLQSSNPLIRLRTVRTCCHLMRPLMRLMHESYATDRALWLKYVKFIAEVVDQLINVGISDHSVDVRLTVFGHCFSTEHTTPRLDNFLEQCEALNKMFLGLSDGSLAVKKAVLGVLCRLSNQNPALVLPELRLFLMDTLFVLKLGGTDKAKQQSARLLSMLVNCPQFFVSTYLELILLQLIPMLTKPSIEATGSTGASSFADRQCSVELSVVILNTVGEIAQLDEYGIIKEQYLDHLMEVLVEYMQDYSSEERRRASVRALTQIAQSTGYVVEPYRKYPQIMDILLKFLKSQSESKFRGEVLQALGVLGAIDPYTYNGWAQSIDHSYETSAFALSLCEPKGIHERDARQQIIQWFARERLTLEDFYPAIVIASAMHVLQDPSLSNYHLVMMNLIETFFRGLADKGHLYLDQVVPQMLVIIRAPENFNTTISQNLISRMANLIEIMPDKMGSYIGDILELIREIWDPRSNLTKVIIPLIEQIARTQSAIFAKHIPSLMGGMLQVFSGDRHRNQEVVSQVFCALKACRPSLQDYVHLIVPPIFQIMEDPIMDNDIRILAINTVISFADYLKLENSASAILHPLWRVLSAPAFCPEAHSTALKCVCAMILQLQGRFSAYQQTFDKVLRTFRPGVNHLDTSEYNRLISMYVQKQAGPLHADGDKAIISRTLNEPTTLGNLLSITTKDSNTEALSMEVKKVYSCFTKEEWVEWMRSLFTSLVRYSVSRAILSCIEASLVYQPLIHDLFNAAFMSCWTSLSEEQKDDWTKAMEYAISFSGVPEITILILRLAEFMEHSEKGPLPIAPKTLGEQAYKSRAFAKALHYKEQQFLAAEMEGNQVVLAETIEQLISINNKLQLKEAGKGLLKYAEARGINLSPRALEKLHDWEGALRRCNEIIGGASMEVEQTPETMERVHLAKMRSLSALARWSELDEVVTDCSKRTVFKDKGKLYELGADAAWGQKNWSKLEKYAKQLNPNTFQGAYYKAVTSIHGGKGNSQTSLEIISRARDLLDSNLTSVASESYERAYSTMVSVQAVAELEECVRYQVLKNERPKIRQIWQKRLHTGVRRDVDDWHRLVRIRSLVLSPDSKNQDEVESTNELPCRSTPVFVRQNPAVIEAAKLELKFEEEDLSYTKLKFASLCRKNGMLDLSRHIMVEMFGYDPKEKDFRLSREKPDLSLAYAKYMWQSNDPSMSQTSLRQVAFDRLLSLTESEEAKKYFERLEGSNWEGDRRLANKLKSKMYLQLGLMKESLTTSPDEASISKTVQFYHQAATMCDYGRSWYKAWHALARSSYEALRFYQREREATQAARQATFGQPQVPHMPLPIGLPPGVPGLPAHMPPSIPPNQEHLRNHAHALVQRYRQDDQAVQDYAISCVRCFVKAIQIAPKSCLQDTLRLLRVLFDFGHITDVHDELHQNLPSLGVTPWLQVIPQLTARIETSRHNVRRLVSSILQGIAREHPHALIYPITVITKSNNQARVAAAERILKPMREQHKSLVDQAKLLSDELIRVAILWPELWHEALEEASRQYFAERNIQGMLNTLRPLHRMIEAGHQTNNENSFNMNYSKQLKEAEEACRRYELTRNARELTHAWEYYYDVFRQITKSLPALNELRTPEVSPLLNAQRNMDIIVPGTYDPGKAPILIQKINQVISVIMSKQRPRKVSILGTDGQEYQFLLKGHEDPRQDERVMQLFGLVNALLLEDPTTSRRNLTIQRYSVTALSQNSGLIGWVPHCDTLHQLLREYRERKKVLLNKEHKLMQNMAPDYDHLTLPQKVEVFESALDETQDLGMDLAKIFWFKSPDSETWFLRRTNYTCSLAVMSMVGYVLGLGDRHPSNLMLDRMSGKIVHIDFGDCFEVAMTREKFPEKIPFRLTRMLVKAMEVTGIEGNYRLTCERVMRVLREHSDSLMAVLEAFIYDPLVNWRLDSAATADPSAPQSHGPPPMGMPPPNMVPPERDAFGQLEHDALAGPADIPNSAIETTSRRAYEVLERVRAKLQGRDFNLAQPLDVEKQVDRLIEAATRHENLCQCYIGWCPFW